MIDVRYEIDDANLKAELGPTAAATSPLWRRAAAAWFHATYLEVSHHNWWKAYGLFAQKN